MAEMAPIDIRIDEDAIRKQVESAITEALREARAETWDEAIATVFAWWNAPEETRPAYIVNPYGEFGK